MPLTHPRAAAGLRGLALALPVVACALFTTIGSDARWLAALGGLIARTGHVPNGVPYAAAVSTGWHNVPVLGELVFSGLERGLGDEGLVLAQAAAVAVALAVVARGMAAEAAVVLPLVPIAALDAFLVVRGQLFSLALFPLLVLLLRREAAAPSRRIWLLVPLVALWANLHGGVLLGVAVAACYLLLDRLLHDRWTTLAVLLAAVAALLATPAGLETVVYYRHVFGNAWAVSHQGLWAQPSLRRPSDLAFLGCVLPLAFLAARTRPRPWELPAGAGLALAAATAARNEVWLVLFVAPVAVRRFRELPPPSPRVRAAFLLIALLACAALLALAAGSHRSSRRGAGPSLRRLALATAGDTPILADPYDEEQLALDGAKIVIGNPIDAFDQRDQRLYLHWLQGSRAATSALAGSSRVILVGKGEPQQARLARDREFCRTAADRFDVLYTRCADPRPATRR